MASQLERHAGEELAKYVQKITGNQAKTVESDEHFEMKIGTDYLILSNAEVNPVSKRLRDKGIVPALGEMPKKESGFLISGFSDGLYGPNGVVIAGSGDVGTLYGVYHYLEEFAGCGFFRDGEYVPSLSRMPTGAIFTLQEPQFKYRAPALIGGRGYLGLDKFEPWLWSTNKWKNEMEWMTKRKLNYFILNMSWQTEAAGNVPYEVFDLGEQVEQPGYLLSYVNGWSWPREYRTQQFKQVLDYARFLGHKICYGVAWGDVPEQYLDDHPEVKILGKNNYGSVHLDPKDPDCNAIMYKYWKAVAEIFGHPDDYFSGIYAEWDPGTSAKESIKLNIVASKECYQTLKKISPNAGWVADSWSFIGPRWTDENTRLYFQSLPKEMDFFINDACADFGVPPLYESTDHFYGQDWTFGVLASYGGDDSMHGNMDNVFARIKQTTHDPRADRLKGVLHVAELLNDNIMLFNLVFHLAWDPDRFDSVGQYLDWYALHRYGRENFAVTRPMIQQLYEAVYKIPPTAIITETTEKDLEKKTFTHQYYFHNNPYYQFHLWVYGGTWGGLDGYNNHNGMDCRQTDRDIFHKEVPALAEAIRSAFDALDVNKELADNKLFENDLVDMARTYLGLRFNLEMIDAYDAFKAKDSEAFERAADKSLNTMTAVEKILSSRDDFSMQRMIDEVMKVPGANRYTPEMIKFGHIAGGCYASRDCYEMTKLYYRPRIEAYYELLKTKMASGVTTITFPELTEMFKQKFYLGETENRKGLTQCDKFLQQDVRLSADNALLSTPIEAVRKYTDHK